MRPRGVAAEDWRTCCARNSDAETLGGASASAMQSTRSVSTRAGQMAFTVMRCGASSWASVCVNPMTANFEAQSAANRAEPTLPEVERRRRLEDLLCRVETESL